MARRYYPNCWNILMIVIELLNSFYEYHRFKLKLCSLYFGLKVFFFSVSCTHIIYIFSIIFSSSSCYVAFCFRVEREKEPLNRMPNISSPSNQSNTVIFLCVLRLRRRFGRDFILFLCFFLLFLLWVFCFVSLPDLKVEPAIIMWENITQFLWTIKLPDLDN